ncbi:C-type lectin protein [Aspergillus transmontanensis]|uniref:C-type lectin protein n=1 Tax=Aspergillus transmontanensis TaxID=1034304 RepID=A0A5N6WGJ6_9EURO|nr:C-type lectin protein [Aspergillus transmontanensis]
MGANYPGTLNLMETSQYAFPLKPKEYAPGAVPTLEEWQKLWAAWDLVTLKMFPKEALHEQPIALRNPLIFYLGHIPTFSDNLSEDIHLARATKTPPTEPKYYQQIFERGIDPDVDDPSQCHDHSEVPNTWPELNDILEFREKVCTRITALYQTQKPWQDRTIGRALWIGFEHEGLHLETFLWMTLMSPNILPPPDVPRPDFIRMAEQAVRGRVENQWFRIKPRTFTIGIEDTDDDSALSPADFFAWDNERNPYEVSVQGFEAQARPASILDYATYLVKTSQKDCLPVTWSTVSGLPDRNIASSPQGDPIIEEFIDRLAVKTVYGLLPLRLALDWPVYTSYNEAVGYAEWAGARLPTLHEARSIHRQVEEENAEKTQESQNREPASKSIRDDIYTDLTGCNVGLQNFHPTPITQNGNRLSGQGDLGGAYEWTSSLFEPQPNFKPMDIYPGYSADFMDGKHILVVGGSWALHPRISGKKIFLNWWQKGYPYPWIGIRLVRDTK